MAPPLSPIFSCRAESENKDNFEPEKENILNFQVEFQERQNQTNSRSIFFIVTIKISIRIPI